MSSSNRQGKLLLLAFAKWQLSKPRVGKILINSNLTQINNADQSIIAKNYIFCKKYVLFGQSSVISV